MKYEKICLMVPTYKRVPRIATLINSAIETSDDPSRLCFCFCVNKKDAETIGYLELRSLQLPIEIILEETKQPNLSLYFNKMFNETKYKDAIVSELGDDMVFISKGWDTRVLDEIESSNGNGIVYFEDAFTAHDRCCVNLFITRELVTLTKKPFMCEFFHADMIDMIWTMVGAMVGILRFQRDMTIKHNHSSGQQQNEWDETFRRLVPVQRIANSVDKEKLALAYSTLCAKNIIDAGVGQWNILN